MKLDIKAVKRLADDIEKYSLKEVTIESEGVKLTLKKEKPIVEEKVIQQVIKTHDFENVDEKKINETETSELTVAEYITSPMVGTFYTSSAPGNPAFVTEGTEVMPGETLCIIEAMKLMNEVKAYKRCKIVKILVENGQIVKKGEKLFVIE